MITINLLTQKMKKLVTNRSYAKEHREYAKLKQRRWRKNNPGRHAMLWRTRTLKNKYGLTLDRYAEMLAGQGGKCAICKGNQRGNGTRNFAIDHDHKTGAVRGLLCDRCNVGLGHFVDNRALLLEGADYLAKHDRLSK